jgi:hypothetical protein
MFDAYRALQRSAASEREVAGLIEFNGRGRTTSCEYVDAGGGVALVRVHASEGAQLVVRAGESEQRFEPVAAGDGQRGPTGFAVPAELLARADAHMSLCEPGRGARPLAAEPARPRRKPVDLERDRLAAELRRRTLAESRARKALDRAADERAALTRELHEVKRRLATLDRDFAQAWRERDRAVARLDASSHELEAANARADAADRVASGRQLTIERLERRLEAQRRTGAFAHVSLREAKVRARRLQGEVGNLERELEREHRVAVGGREQCGQLELALSAQRAAAELLRDELERREDGVVAPSTALRQLVVSVAARNGGGQAPPLIDRFARRRRFTR